MSDFVYKAVAQTSLGPFCEFAHTRDAAVAMVAERLRNLQIHAEIKAYVYTGGEDAQ